MANGGGVSFDVRFMACVSLEDTQPMKRLLTTPAWTALARRLKRQFQNLTDAQLAELSTFPNGWLQRLCDMAGASVMEVASIVEECVMKERLTPSLAHYARNEEWNRRHLVNSARYSVSRDGRALDLRLAS